MSDAVQVDANDVIADLQNAHARRVAELDLELANARAIIRTLRTELANGATPQSDPRPADLS